MARLVSVCLPVCNGARFVEAAMRSVLAQTHTDLELIVVDDCSNDNSAEIIGSLAAEDQRIRFYTNEIRLGLFENYNKCMQLARGKYIKPFAQDDVFEPTIVARLVSLIESESDIALVSCARNWIDDQGQELPMETASTPSASDFFPSQEPISGAKLLQCSIFPIINLIGEPATVLFPASLIGTGFDLHYEHLGDLEYWLRLLQNGTYVCIADRLCKIRDHGERQSVKNFESLAVASDYLELAKRLSPAVEKLGYSTEGLMRSSLIEIAQHIDYLVRNGKLSIPTSETCPDIPLFELAFRSLLMIAANHQPFVHPGILRKINFNERHILRMERYLRQLLSDPGWYYTRPLREIRRLLDSEQINVRSHVAAPEDQNTAQSVLQKQCSYLHFLRKTAVSVRLSRSWALRSRVNYIINPVMRFFCGSKNAAPLFNRQSHKDRYPSLVASKIDEAVSFDLSYLLEETLSEPVCSDATAINETELGNETNVAIEECFDANAPETEQDSYINRDVAVIIGPLKQEYEQLKELEPLLLSIDELSKLSEYRTPATSLAGSAYLELASLVDKPFEQLLVLSKSDCETAKNFAAAVIKKHGPDAILAIYADEISDEVCEGSFSELAAFPEDMRLLCLDDIVPGLSIDDRIAVLLRLVIQAKPKNLINIGSKTCWLTFRNYHRQLRKHTRLIACMAKLDDDDAASREIAYLNSCIDHINEVTTTSVAERKQLIDFLSLELKIQEKIHVAQDACLHNLDPWQSQTIVPQEQLRVSIMETGSGVFQA